MARARIAAFIAAALAAVAGAGAAVAQEIPGLAREWQLGLQDPISPGMRQINEFHDLLVVIIVGICVFVLALLAYVIVRYRESRNPTPSKNSHNTVIEVLWTVVPVLILVVIAIPSFKLLYFTDRAENADMTVKAIGNQWYWSYEYPDHGNFTFDAYIACRTAEECQTFAQETQAQAGDVHRLLTTDNAVVVPVNTTVRLLTTATDVLHAWALPAFGVKLDAVPGQLNETWFRAEKEGVFFGQCSELCGVDHAFMPIMVHVVSREAFAQWIQRAQAEYRTVEPPARAEAPAAAPQISGAQDNRPQGAGQQTTSVAAR